MRAFGWVVDMPTVAKNAVSVHNMWHFFGCSYRLVRRMVWETSCRFARALWKSAAMHRKVTEVNNIPAPGNTRQNSLHPALKGWLAHCRARTA